MLDISPIPGCTRRPRLAHSGGVSVKRRDGALYSWPDVAKDTVAGGSIVMGATDGLFQGKHTSKIRMIVMGVPRHDETETFTYG